MVFLKGILPRELVSDGVLEYKIPSSTIWNRCSWAGTDFRNDDSDNLNHQVARKFLALFTSTFLQTIPDICYIQSNESAYAPVIRRKEGVGWVLCPDQLTPLSPRLTVFLWCSEFPSCLAPFEIGYNVEGLSTKLLPQQLPDEFHENTRRWQHWAAIHVFIQGHQVFKNHWSGWRFYRMTLIRYKTYSIEFCFLSLFAFLIIQSLL